MRIVFLDYTYAERGELVPGKNSRKESSDEVTLRDLTGMAVQDFVISVWAPDHAFQINV